MVIFRCEGLTKRYFICFQVCLMCDVKRKSAYIVSSSAIWSVYCLGP